MHCMDARFNEIVIPKPLIQELGLNSMATTHALYGFNGRIVWGRFRDKFLIKSTISRSG